MTAVHDPSVVASGDLSSKDNGEGSMSSNDKGEGSMGVGPRDDGRVLAGLRRGDIDFKRRVRDAGDGGTRLDCRSCPRIAIGSGISSSRSDIGGVGSSSWR